MGGAEGSREVQAGGARSMGSLYICVKTPARSGVHEGPHWSCMQPWVVDPVSLSCRKVTLTYLPHSARAGVPGSSAASATASLLVLPSQERACFVCEFVCGRSAAPNRGYWHLCRAVGGGARGPACRAPGSIGGVFGLSPSLLIPGRAAFCSLCCQIYPRRSGFCLHLAPSCWYLTRPASLPATRPRLCLFLSCSVRLIDWNRSSSITLRSVLSARNASGLAGGCSNARLRPSSRILQCGIVQLHSTNTSTSIAQPAHTPSPTRPHPRSHRRRPSVRACSSASPRCCDVPHRTS